MEMQNTKLAGAKPSVSTQQYLDIAEIKENTVILKDGTLRAVILVSSINFALKSEEEQDALVSAYVEFLNSLAYPVQIVIQSRKLNMTGYLNDLREKAKNQTNELLKIQIINYIQYITELVELGEIMTKKFFVVAPYSPYSDRSKGFFKRLKEAVSPASAIKISAKKLADFSRDLDIRVSHIQGSLRSMGLNSVRLDTQGLIELYYNCYNPETAESEKLTDVKQIRVEQEF